MKVLSWMLCVSVVAGAPVGLMGCEQTAAAKVPVELHLFGEGGHGFGLRGVVGKPAAAWPDLFVAWAKSRGWLGAA